MRRVSIGRIGWRFAWLGVAFMASVRAANGEAVSSPEIDRGFETLRVWNSDSIASDYQAGELLLVDFFAHWCGPCLGVSKELGRWEKEAGVKGLRVLPVNVERRSPSKTDAFIRKAELEAVYFDSEGDLAKQLGVQALPYLALVRVEPEGSVQRFRVLERFTSYPGIEVLESRVAFARRDDDPATVETTAPEAPVEIVESVEAIAPPVVRVDRDEERAVSRPSRATVEPEAEVATVPEVEEKAVQSAPVSPVWETPVDPAVNAFSISGGFDRESLVSDDVEILNTSTRFGHTGMRVNATLSVSRNTSELTYSPSSSDLVGVASERDETSTQLGFDVEWVRSEAFSGLMSIGAYEGFTDYRSVWLDEFYRQQFEPVDGYEVADPRGYSVALGGRWVYIPATAILDVVGGYQFDRVSPAYEAIPFEPLTRGRSEIGTSFVRVASENLLSERIRIKQQLQAADTSDRSLRFSYLLAANFALSERIVVRTETGHTRESSDFDSKHFGVVLDGELGMGFRASGFVRRYSDSGEIVDPLILSTASPSLRTRQYGLSFSWKGERAYASLAAGRYKTLYDELPAISFQFENLYRDRDWDFVKISTGFNF